MPHKKGQPKKLPTLTVKELQEINVQQETTKPAISKAVLARYFLVEKTQFYTFLRSLYNTVNKFYTFLRSADNMVNNVSTFLQTSQTSIYVTDKTELQMDSGCTRGFARSRRTFYYNITGKCQHVCNTR